LNPRMLIAHALASICSTSTPGAIRRTSGMFEAPDLRISSCVMTNIAEAACESFCSFLDTEVTVILGAWPAASRIRTDNSTKPMANFPALQDTPQRAVLRHPSLTKFLPTRGSRFRRPQFRESGIAAVRRIAGHSTSSQQDSRSCTTCRETELDLAVLQQNFP
jgi:hypothetical protein